MKPDNYKNLVVWQKSMDLVVEIYRYLNKYPSYEQYGLCDQIRRSAVSIPSNIAEGFCRDSQKDIIRFLNIARGSAGELETQILLSERLEYIEKIEANDILYKINGINVMLVSLISKLRSDLNKE